MKVINLSKDNSLLNQYLKEIRSVSIQKDSMRFRRNIERIGEIVAYEVSKTLDYSPEQVTTPLGVITIPTMRNTVVLATVLRAGLPYHHGFLSFFDQAESAFLSAYRRLNEQKKIEIVSEYLAAPALDGKTLLLVDPMLATGLSMEAAYKALLTHGTPAKVHLCCVIGAQSAVDYLQTILPDNVTLWCVAIDPELNTKKYICPGLGDAGDLCFGDKL